MKKPSSTDDGGDSGAARLPWRDTGEFLQEVMVEIATSQRISDFWPSHGRASFEHIRMLYRTINVDHYNAYPVDWARQFTPIERMAWGEIRYYGLPFWPQLPIGQYFADFADPKKKIVIECDGKAFHDKDRDATRDKWMTDLGWDVFRISGADCNRLIDPPWETISEDEIEHDSTEGYRLLHEWHTKTVDGLVSSIASYYYGRRAPDEHVRETLMLRLCDYAKGGVSA